MKKSAIFVSAVFFAMLGLATVLLHKVQDGQKLGTPGVIVGNDPIYNDANEFVTNTSVTLPKNLPKYESVAMPITKMELQWLPPDTVYGRREYRGEDGFAAQVSVVLMGRDRTSIHKPQYCLTGQGWKITKSEVVDIPMTKPGPYSLKAMKLTTTGDFPTREGTKITRNGLYVYWFVADNQLTPDHLERMLWFARDMLTEGVMQRWAYIAYFSTCAPGLEDALFKRMTDLIVEATPQFQLASGASPSAIASSPTQGLEIAGK